MASPLDNPAARLHVVLEKLRVLPPNTPIRQAAAQTLAPDAPSSADLARRIGLLYSLPDQVVSEVEAASEVISRDMLLRWHEPVTRALNNLIFTAGGINAVCQHYGDGDMVALQLCSDLLHRYRPEPSLSATELERIADLVNDLLTTLEQDSELDTGLREVLLSHARAMRRAIGDVPLGGSGRLQAAVAETCGSLILRPDLVVRRDTSTATWQKVTAVLGAITAAFSFGTAAVQALEAPPTAAPTTVIVQEPAAPSAAPGGAMVVNDPRTVPAAP